MELGPQNAVLFYHLAAYKAEICTIEDAGLCQARADRLDTEKLYGKLRVAVLL